MEIKKYKLTDICDFQGGSQPPKKEWSKSKKEGYVRMLQIRDFTQSHKNNVEYVKVSKRLKTCKTDDVLIGRYGASVGKILTGLEGAYNVAIMKTIPNEKVLSKKYLLALLKAPLFQNFILSVGVRAAQAGFNKDDLSKFQVYLPSLDNQKRIAKVLFDCENLIQKREESIKLLDEFLKSTFSEMFEHTKGETISLNDVIEIQSGLVSPNEPPYNEMFHVGGANIESETGNLVNLKKAKEENLISGKYLFTDEYILYSKIRPYLNKVAIMNFTGICSADVYPIKTMDKNILNKYFLKFKLQSQHFLSHANSNSDRANIPKINRKALLSYKFILPSIEVQNQFEKIVKFTLRIKSQFKDSLSELNNLYGSISQTAFKGELDLSKVDISQFDKLNMSETNLEDLSNEVSAEAVTIEKLEQIIKGRFGYQEFSISQIEEILAKQGIDYTTSLVKGFIKDLLSEEKIRTEYSGSTHQVIFKYNI
ncbi:type I restriction enzyme, S subunit [Aquimarina amphilecti]|uniref:Type I restriction enzyme, S subunit n=1 Tax=Aquimarina amphilecti TaxID=1038014 RepID=A0A1H7X594_AQUAM|nr:restriction endonuclease subunit S [Aquimarina amphilecti]SEM28841.1 type I restriction enzyme, S subunit [Aquimarina amphilecti]